MSNTHTFTVFLGEGNTVKLGDFGLSKIILSHDFASTYVGTPFYMSPEICAAERYSLYSDIWSLGCIVYELCTREPPFNARTHLELIQKIKLGKVAPLPRMYSKELSDVISACLQVNPNSRPDTASLLNLPRVKMVRKTQEGVMVLQQHITAKENAIAALKSAQEQISRLEGEKQAMHEQIDKQLRLEWETKAHLEINRQMDIAGERLRDHYRILFEQQVEEEVERRLASLPSSQTSSNNSASELTPPKRSSTPTQSLEEPSSLVTIGEADDEAPNLNALTLDDSPLLQRHKPLRSSNRTPFTRAKTFAGMNEVAQSPMDIQMADPSPMSIASLSLSPRRNAPLEGSKLRQPAFKGPNMFDRAVRGGNLTLFPEDAEDEDGFDTDSGSPIRSRPSSRETDPFKVVAQPSQPSRPTMSRQKTMPAQVQSRLKTVPNLVPSTRRAPPSPSRSPMNKGLTISPSRRAPAIPSQPSKTALATKRGSAKGDDMLKTVHRNNLQQGIQGRTLVELAQARGTSIEVPKVSTKVPLDKEPLWDPERDEMPSPFLVKTRKAGIMPR
jgi:serine/threonine protein kinase